MRDELEANRQLNFARHEQRLDWSRQALRRREGLPPLWKWITARGDVEIRQARDYLRRTTAIWPKAAKTLRKAGKLEEFPGRRRRCGRKRRRCVAPIHLYEAKALSRRSGIRHHSWNLGRPNRVWNFGEWWAKRKIPHITNTRAKVSARRCQVRR